MGHTHCVSQARESDRQTSKTKGSPASDSLPRPANSHPDVPGKTGTMILPNLNSEKSIIPVRLKDPEGRLRQAEVQSDVVREDSAMTHLQESGWYWGSISAAQAKQVLSETLEGTFLLRDSSNPAYWLTLSVKTSLGPTHLRIEHSGGAFGFDSLAVARPRLRQFGGAVELVQHYALANQPPAGLQDKADPQEGTPGEEGPETPEASLQLMLTRPLYQSPPTLQHLCRISINKYAHGHQELPLPARLKDYLQGYPFLL